MDSLSAHYRTLQTRITCLAQTHAVLPVKLVAVSKTQSAMAIRSLAALGQYAFGENYVQEALDKQRELTDLKLEWHCIGHLQSNKCQPVAEHFDWLQSLDREKLIASLNRYRPTSKPPLNVLIQVNIDNELGKSGCNPEHVASLAAHTATMPRLKLRGLMAIPSPHPQIAQRLQSFRQMRKLFEILRQQYSTVDTLSMGMSEDFELAIAEGATMVRIGSALFGSRSASIDLSITNTFPIATT